MNKFNITIENIQHIKKLELELDLAKFGIYVIIGKNGVGKTTLFKAIDNLITSTTFITTSHPYIYQKDSQITYSINDGTFNYCFKYDDKIKTLDYHGTIDENIIKNIYVELPIPFGKRFRQFKSLSNIDKQMRLSIISKNFIKPDKLIKILNYIYNTKRFDNLKEIVIGKEYFYAIVEDNKPYIREDYLSSSEYFVITIYKLIMKECKLLAIDEIDISLDSSAQVRFTKIIRDLALEYKVKIFFSTHSLALIKTLESDELFYMNSNDGVISFEKTTHSEMQWRLYGLQDYQKDFEKLKKMVDEESKPIIITEGPTDWKHLKKALERFKKNELYLDLDLKFLEYDNTIEMGDACLKSMLEGYKKASQNKKVIFIFDRDNTEILNKYGKSEFNNHGNNVYSFCIPKIDSNLDSISIEFFYNERDLKKEDLKKRRLFLSTEFYTSSGNSKCGNFQIKDRNKVKKLTIIDSYVYKREDIEWKDSVALSKNSFADNIMNEVENFKDFDLKHFKLIFKIIKKVIDN